MTRTGMIEKYIFDVATYTARALDEIVHLINEDNKWNIEKFISFDVLDNNTWQINFWGQDENIVFKRVSDTNYFKAIL